MATYSTVEVAEMADVSWNTISRWIREKKFAVPPVKMVGRVRVRLWTEAEIAVVREYKKNYYRGKGSQKKLKKRK